MAASAIRSESTTRIALDRIAVLTDFSKSAEIALCYASRLAREYSSQLLLVHAYSSPFPAFPSAKTEVVLGYDPGALGETKGVAERQMTDQLKASFLQGTHAWAILSEGSVSRMLKDLKDIDLIVVGTAGRTGPRKMLLGSTAEAVFRKSTVPVLTVGPQSRPVEATEMALRTILLAANSANLEEPAIRYALSIAREHDAKLMVLHTVPEAEAPFSFDKGMTKSKWLEDLRRVVAPEEELWCQPELIVAFGDTAETILAEAAKSKADLIVMGARGVDTLAAASTHLTGGTAYRVAAEASCPVLTVRGVH